VIIFIYLLLIFLFFKKDKISFKEITQSLSKNEFLTIIFGLCWFLVYLAPVGLLPYRSDLYIFIPQIGLFISMAIIIRKIFGMVSEKLPGYTKTMLFSLLIIILIWTGYLAKKLVHYDRIARKNTEFTSIVQQSFDSLITGTPVMIIDCSKGEPRLSKAISYGLTALLNLVFPRKNLHADFFNPDENKMNVEKLYRYKYIWDGKTLYGPYEINSEFDCDLFSIGSE
jgi:hypothetical protein